MQLILIVAITLDGFIAQHTTQASTDWTSQEDKQHFNTVTKQAGVIIMGETTFGTIGFPLPKRLNIIYSRESLPAFGKKFNLNQQQLAADKLRITILKPAELKQQLEQEGVKQAAVCGGSSIYTQFMQAGVVDKLLITVEPVLFGDGIKLFNQPIEQKLSLVSKKQLNDHGTLLLEYDCV